MLLVVKTVKNVVMPMLKVGMKPIMDVRETGNRRKEIVFGVSVYKHLASIEWNLVNFYFLSASFLVLDQHFYMIIGLISYKLILVYLYNFRYVISISNTFYVENRVRF